MRVCIRVHIRIIDELTTRRVTKKRKSIVLLNILCTTQRDLMLKIVYKYMYNVIVTTIGNTTTE